MGHNRAKLEVLGHKPADDALSMFAEWFLSHRPNLPFKPPCDHAVQVMDSVHGITMWREGRFQVQCFVCAPNTVVPVHTHPNVDSFEVNMDGGVEFYVDGRLTLPKKVVTRRDGDASAWYGFAVRVRAGTPHNANIGPNGGAFLSIQHWPEGLTMSSVAHDWDGDTMGPLHTAQMVSL